MQDVQDTCGIFRVREDEILSIYLSANISFCWFREDRTIKYIKLYLFNLILLFLFIGFERDRGRQGERNAGLWFHVCIHCPVLACALTGGHASILAQGDDSLPGVLPGQGLLAFALKPVPLARSECGRMRVPWAAPRGLDGRPAAKQPSHAWPFQSASNRVASSLTFGSQGAFGASCWHVVSLRAHSS